MKGEFNESDGRFSPNMRWVAYVSDESGRSEVYVRAFSQASQPAAETTGKWQISVEGGLGPRWRRDGKELYYRAPDGKAMAVDVIDDTVFQPGTPELLFESPPADMSTLWSVPCWDAASDGRFLLATHPSMEPTPFTVILNWTASRK
ncbi:MAG: PD40 domain-containing protein [Acidobacteria bacterium]|nr:PD40 domain-containing protein [Acidobacteriota bacterium]